MAINSLHVIARLKAKEDKRNELRSLLSGLVSLTREEPGCLSYELLENMNNELEFTFVEEWRDEQALSKHFETDHIQNAIEMFPELVDGDLRLTKYQKVK
ncbi:MAG: putative quinol monooxygenase [Balneolaceae bacterium]|nr:putative quinol monooxygenase [Balneolaceae bacterium]